MTLLLLLMLSVVNACPSLQYSTELGRNVTWASMTQDSSRCYGLAGVAGSFKECLNACAQLSGAMACPRDDDTNAFILSLVREVSRSGFLGLTDLLDESHWFCVASGARIEWINWVTPNDFWGDDHIDYNPENNCATMLVDGKWVDHSCESTEDERACVCENSGTRSPYVDRFDIVLPQDQTETNCTIVDGECYTTLDASTATECIEMCDSIGGSAACPLDREANADLVEFAENSVWLGLTNVLGEWRCAGEKDSSSDLFLGDTVSNCAYATEDGQSWSDAECNRVVQNETPACVCDTLVPTLPDVLLALKATVAPTPHSIAVQTVSPSSAENIVNQPTTTRVGINQTNCTLIDDRCFVIFDDVPTAAECIATCDEIGASTTCPHDEDFNEEISHSAEGHSWLGIVDIFDETEWVCVGRNQAYASSGYTNFDPHDLFGGDDRFFDDTTQNCAYMTHDGTWDDIECDAPRTSYACMCDTSAITKTNYIDAIEPFLLPEGVAAPTFSPSAEEDGVIVSPTPFVSTEDPLVPKDEEGSSSKSKKSRGAMDGAALVTIIVVVAFLVILCSACFYLYRRGKGLPERKYTADDASSSSKASTIISPMTTEEEDSLELTEHNVVHSKLHTT